MPIYDVQDEDNHSIQIGHIQGSKSRVRHPEEVNKECSLSLKINDIDGCKTSTVGNPYIRTRQHGTFTKTNLTKDIPGAQISTLKKGIQTKRHLNPLVPQYVYLDKEGGHSGPATNVKVSTPPKDTPAANDVPQVTNTPPADKGEIKPTEPRRLSEKDGVPAKEVRIESQKAPSPPDKASKANLLTTKEFLNDDYGDAKASVDQPEATTKKASSNIKIKTIDRIPLHKRIDKEKYQHDLEKFYMDTWDEKPKLANNTKPKEDMGDKIRTLQDEMARQKEQFRQTEEAKRQKIAPELLDKPLSNAQR